MTDITYWFVYLNFFSGMIQLLLLQANSFSPNQAWSQPFKNQTIQNLFKWFLTEWLPFIRISDLIQNPDDLQTKLFLTIQNSDLISPPVSNDLQTRLLKQ